MFRAPFLILVLLVAAWPARAVVFEDGGIHLVDTNVPGKDGVQVHDGPGPAATTVTVTATVEAGVSVTGISSATLDGATTGGSVFALDDARLTVVDSEIGNDVFANQQAEVTVQGADVLNNVFALGYAVIDVGATTVGDPLESSGQDVFANDSGRITLHTGTVVLDDVFTNDTASIGVDDAEIGGSLFANGFSQIELEGGSVAEDIQSNGEATVRIVGMDFAVDGAPVPFGPVAALSGTLTGSLSDGSPLANAFTRGEGATILLVAVPEPGAPWMLLGGAGVLAACGRRRPHVQSESESASISPARRSQSR